MPKPKQKKLPWIYDRWIVVIFLSLLAFGLLMVSSASMVISDRQFGYPLHYVLRQAIFAGVGVLLAWVATRIPIKFWRRFAPHLLLVSVLLLIAVLIPGVGRVVNGSRRWINLGFFGFQVSEGVKLCALLYIASYLQRFQHQVRTELIGFIKPMLVFSIIGVLLLLEPDFGTVAVIAATFLLLLFLAGVRLWPFTLLFILIVATMAILAVISPYRMARLTTFLNPWYHAYDSGYQLTQSLIAFGRGGLFGVGLGNSIQKLFYLPEAHTDFIFAVLGEELGLLGELLLIALFVLLTLRIISIARQAQLSGRLFHAYVAYGVGIWLGLQSLINMGVSTGLLPTKGLTLPFISYGGSSLLVNCLAIGILLRIAYEVRVSINDYQLKNLDSPP